MMRFLSGLLCLLGRHRMVPVSGAPSPKGFAWSYICVRASCEHRDERIDPPAAVRPA